MVEFNYEHETLQLEPLQVGHRSLTRIIGKQSTVLQLHKELDGLLRHGAPDEIVLLSDPSKGDPTGGKAAFNIDMNDLVRAAVRAKPQDKKLNGEQLANVQKLVSDMHDAVVGDYMAASAEGPAGDSVRALLGTCDQDATFIALKAQFAAANRSDVFERVASDLAAYQVRYGNLEGKATGRTSFGSDELPDAQARLRLTMVNEGMPDAQAAKLAELMCDVVSRCAQDRPLREDELAQGGAMRALRSKTTDVMSFLRIMPKREGAEPAAIGTSDGDEAPGEAGGAGEPGVRGEQSGISGRIVAAGRGGRKGIVPNK